MPAPDEGSRSTSTSKDAERRTTMRIEKLAVAAVLSLLAAPIAQAAIDGRWIAEFEKNDGRVQLTTKRGSGRHHSTNSSSYPLSAFRGLVRPASRTPAPARFEMARDAGTLVFEGQLDSEGGSGRFSFAPNPDFAREMERAGYSLSEEDLFTATMHDIGRAFLKGLEELGYSRLPFDDLVSMRIHGATPEFIRELKALGYDRLSSDDLVSMRIHGATPEFVREMHAAGHDRFSADELVSMRIHNVTPEFARELKGLGYTDVSVDDLVSMRIHSVTTDFVRQIRELGFRDASVDDLVSMRIHGVSADFARRAKARDPGVTVDELVSMRIHGRG
jgi:hypothetical protein